MGVSVLMGKLLPALAAALAAGGCSSLVFHEGAIGPDTDPSQGEVRLRAPRRGSSDQSRGYGFMLTAPGGELVARVPSGGGPWAFEDLPPGRYDLRITGKRIRPFSVDLKVKAGERTSVTFYPWRERASSAAEDLAIVTGKALLYVVLGIVYVPWLAIEESLFDDDDEEEDDDHFEFHASNDATRKKDKPRDEKKSGGSHRPRVKSLLKDP
jgi:hypothetical protein